MIMRQTQETKTFLSLFYFKLFNHLSWAVQNVPPNQFPWETFQRDPFTDNFTKCDSSLTVHAKKHYNVCELWFDLDPAARPAQIDPEIYLHACRDIFRILAAHITDSSHPYKWRLTNLTIKFSPEKKYCPLAKIDVYYVKAVFEFDLKGKHLLFVIRDKSEDILPTFRKLEFVTLFIKNKSLILF
jgi:hypothetical protein